MSNNAAVAQEGHEIGRAQALQARASGLAPHTDMNPVLLKPETDTGAQVVVQGKRLTSARARDYAQLKPKLLDAVLDSFNRLRAAHDLVMVEGAGSPAEINLRKGDIANMGFAEAAMCRWSLRRYRPGRGHCADRRHAGGDVARTMPPASAAFSSTSSAAIRRCSTTAMP